MSLSSRYRRLILSGIALAVAIAAAAPGVAALPSTSADGAVIEMNKLSPSPWFAGALAVWVLNSYPISVDCSPPRACYAKSQLINYHFSCAPRYIVVGERFSMDLNENVVKHEVGPVGTSGLNYEADSAALERFCGPLPDLSDVRPQRRDPPGGGDKPRKGP